MTVRTSENMNAEDREVYSLVVALFGGTITEDEARRLDELVRNDADARRCYVEFVRDSVMLRKLSLAAEGQDALGGRAQIAGSALAPARAEPAAAGDPPWPAIGHWRPRGC